MAIEFDLHARRSGYATNYSGIEMSFLEHVLEIAGAVPYLEHWKQRNPGYTAAQRPMGCGV